MATKEITKSDIMEDSESCKSMEESQSTVEDRLGPLLADAQTRGVLTEVLVMASYIKNGKKIVCENFRKDKIFEQLGLGSLWTVVRLFKKFTSLGFRRKKEWCREHSLDRKVLSKLSEDIAEYFDNNIQENEIKTPLHTESAVAQLFLKHFPENIWIHLGHKSYGFTNIQETRTAQIDTNLISDIAQFHAVVNLVNERNTDGQLENFIDVDIEGLEEHQLSCSTPKWKCKIDKILSHKALKQECIEGVPSDILSKFSETESGSFKGIYKEISTKLQTERFIIEPNFRNRHLCVYAPKKFIKLLRETVLEVVASMKKENIDLRRIVPYPAPDSDVSLTVAPGLVVKNILLSDDFVEMFIFNKNSSSGEKIEECTLEESLKKYGEIESIFEFSAKEKEAFHDSKIWGKVRFVNPDEAAEAVRIQQYEGQYSGFFLRPIKRKIHKNRDGIVVTLRTLRRPYERKLNVLYRDPQDPRFLNRNNNRFLNCKKFDRYRLLDDEDVINMAGDVKLMEVYGQAVQEVDNDPELWQSLQDKLAITVVKTERSRVKPFHTSRRHYTDFRGVIERHIKDKCQIQDFIVDIPSVTPEDVYMEAKVTLPETCDLAQFKSDWGECCYQCRKVELDPDVNFVVHVPEKVWKVTKGGIDMIRDTITRQASKTCDSIVDVELKNRNHRVEIRSKSIQRSQVICNSVKKLLSPELVTDVPEEGLQQLQRKGGRGYIGTLMRYHGIHVDVQGDKDSISLYGHPDATKEAAEEIRQYLKMDVPQIQRNNIPLCHFNVNSTKNDMLNFLSEYKDRMESLYGVSKIFFDHVGASVTVDGMPQGYVEAKKLIGSLLREKFGSKNKLGSMECCACFCDVVPPSCRLRSCGHVYCETCVKIHLAVSAENKIFPVVCVKEDCGKPMSWQDMQFVCDNDTAAFRKLLKSAVDFYIVQNKGKVKYCGTKDCGSVYRCTAEGKSFHCSLCDVTWCTKCHVPYHTGITCAVNKLVNTDNFDPHVKEWILDDPKKRKICPKCETGIEKISGCNNIHCTNCKASICWNCLKHFDDGSQCYSHLEEEHGGAFDEGEGF